jgi:hypothetical protein
MAVDPKDLLRSAPFVGPLKELDECAADPSDCDYRAGVLGFHADGRVAVIEGPTMSDCGENAPLRSTARVGEANALASAPRISRRRGEGDPLGKRKAQAHVKATAEAGFTAC